MEAMIRHLVDVFKSFKIRYVIIGGIAASIWGRPRMTVDADAVILLSEATVLDLLKMLKKSGFLISKASQPKMAKRLKQLLPVKVRFTRTLSCDIRIANYTIDHQAINNAKKIRIFGTSLPVATPEDVIIYKLVRFEDIDKSDIKLIIQRQGERLNFTYIKNSARRLSEEVGDEGVYHNLQEILRWMKRTNERANL